MLRPYTPEHARSGISKEQFDQEQATQLRQLAQQHNVTIARGPALRAQAVELMAALGTGPGYGALQSAVQAFDAARGPAAQVAAIVVLSEAIERWAHDAVLARDLQRLGAPAAAAEAQRRIAEERSRPVVLTAEQRLERIEKHLGLA